MLTKKTIIGIIAGSIITAIGLFALISSLGVQTVEVDDIYPVAGSTSYQFEAPVHSREFLNFTGKSFHVKLKSPTGGLQVDEDFKNNVSFEWFHLIGGQSRVEIQNTGDSELHIVGALEVNLEPILFTYHIMVIIAGVIIVGFSAGFSVRKPRGF